MKQRRHPLGQRRLRIFPENIHAVGSSLWLSFIVRMVHVVGVGNPIIGVETVGGREHFWVMTEVPLTKAGGGITL